MTTCPSWLSLAARATPDQERGRAHRWSAPPDERLMRPAPVLIALGCAARESPAPPEAVPGPGRSPGCRCVALHSPNTMEVAVSEAQQVVRVRAVSDDARTLHFEMKNGLVITASAPSEFTFNPGDVLLYDQANSRLTLCDPELWPTTSSVGTVRLKDSERTVVDLGNRWTSVPTYEDIQYDVGNTVEFDEYDGVLNVLSEKSINPLDALHVDDQTIAAFRTYPGEEATVSFDDFGGLPDVVDRAKELVEVPLKYKDSLEKINAKAVKGVLFTGLPGTGKTMLARIIAQVSRATFYEINGPEVISKWVGQSEELIRMIFQDAGKQERAIVFFDELDSIGAKREADSHESSRRVVAQLLTELDGFHQDRNVIVIATTNRPQDIDKALRRPGRLDWEVHFPLPNLNDRSAILMVSSKEISTAGTLPIEELAGRTKGWSAAELAGIWTEAALRAVQDDREAIYAEDCWGGFERVSAKRRLQAEMESAR